MDGKINMILQELTAINESKGDDKFNKHLSKIQDAIQALENLELESPVVSQVNSLMVASTDLSNLAKKLEKQRD